jgi:hypothetical protein
MRPNAVTKASPLLWTLYACLTLLALLSGCIPPTSAAETPDYRSTLQPTASPASATPGGEETAAAVELHRLVAESVPAYQPRSATWESTPIAQLGPGSEFLAHDSLHRLPDVNGGWVRHPGVVPAQLADADATWSPTAKHRTPEAPDFVYVTNGQHRHTLLRHVRDGEEFAFQGRLFVARRTASSFAVRATGVTLNRVVRTFERQSDELVDVDMIMEREQNSLRLTGTPQHPFYSLDRADYIGMGDLRVGEQLLTVEGRHATVAARTIRPESATVFNFEVEHAHNYFVGDLHGGDDGVLVHNSCFQSLEAPPIWRSRPNWGHTFDTHGAGARTTRDLTGRAGGTGQPQGQWLNNDVAAQNIFSQAQTLNISAPTHISIPQGLGQVIMPDGSVVPATRALVVPNGSGGIRTAYPVLGN